MTTVNDECTEPAVPQLPTNSGTTPPNSGNMAACRYVSDSALKIALSSPSQSPAASCSSKETSPRDSKSSSVQYIKPVV
jgi:hypothetical protein